MRYIIMAMIPLLYLVYRLFAPDRAAYSEERRKIIEDTHRKVCDKLGIPDDERERFIILLERVDSGKATPDERRECKGLYDKYRQED